MKRLRWTSLGLRLAACGLAGAVVTVAVAWASASVFAFNFKSLTYATAALDRDEDPLLVYGLGRRPAGRCVTAISVTTMTRNNTRAIIEDSATFRRKLAPWARRIPETPGVRTVEARGWPVVALGAEATGLGEPAYYRAFAVRLPWQRWDSPTRGASTAMVPLDIHWPGFALDTAFYGTLVFLFWSAPGFVRRRVWWRRGRCIACGYDLRGNGGRVCPECGT